MRRIEGKIEVAQTKRGRPKKAAVANDTLYYLDFHGNLTEDLVEYLRAGQTKSGKCYIKMTSGGFFFNPLNSYRHDIWHLREVTDAVFKSYILFLQTKDTDYLRTGEKLFQNG